MKNILEILFLLLLPFLVLAQESVPWNRELVADALEIDRLGNIYLVKGNVVAKYDAEMNFLCAYDNYPAGRKKFFFQLPRVSHFIVFHEKCNVHRIQFRNL